MGKRGPAGKPTALKEMAGNPGKRAMNRREPRPRVMLPAAPRHLNDEARREWRRMGRELLALGVLTSVDRAALAAYCVAYSRWVEAEGQVTKLGTIVKTAAGNLIQNPYLAVANRAMEQMCRLAGEFGMTPSSRSRVQAQAPTNEPSLADILFADVVALSEVEVGGHGEDEDAE